MPVPKERKSQQFEGTAGTHSLSGDCSVILEITTSTLSADMLSDHSIELEGLSRRGSNLQCRDCNSNYPQRKDTADLFSDLCSSYKLASTSPLIHQVKQPVRNAVKNLRNEIPFQITLQQEEPVTPVVEVADEESGIPTEDNPPPEGNSPPEDKSQHHTPVELEPFKSDGKGNMSRNRLRGFFKEYKCEIFACFLSFVYFFVILLVWQFVVLPQVYPQLIFDPYVLSSD